ncbi:hypothetical protein WJX84_000628 [Apatococcus fuscideae]|uniref:Tetratricopeptide repeat protein n=1 Tax=Apatococcus fuscideae TaxID=2026836 RepID=A0AAW1TE49_9CHLO
MPGPSIWELPCSQGQCIGWSMQHQRPAAPHRLQPEVQRRQRPGAHRRQPCRHARQTNEEQSFWDDSSSPSGSRPSSRSSRTAAVDNGPDPQLWSPDGGASSSSRDFDSAVDPDGSSYFGSSPPQMSSPPAARSRRRQTATMDSQDYDGNDPWQEVPEHLSADDEDAAPGSAGAGDSWDELHEPIPEAEWGQGSKWKAAHAQDGLQDPFHDPKWERPDRPGAAQQIGSSWDEGDEEMGAGGRQTRSKAPQNWDWVSPAEARRRKQLQEVEVAELVDSAIEASDAGDPEAALRLLLDARRLSPDDPFLLMRLGVLLGRMGEPDRALLALNQAYSIEHNDAQILKYRGIALAACGKHQEAVYCFNHAHDLQPSDAEVLKLRAVTHGEMGLTKQRMEDLNAAVALDIDNADLYRTRGIAHRMVKDDAAALADFTQAIRLAPGVSQLHLERAGTAIRLGNYDQAMEDLQIAEQLEPQQVNTIWDLAMVLDRQNAPEQALKLFDWANTLDPGNSIILRRRAFCRSKLKDYAGAVEDLEEAVAVSPRNPYLLKDLGFNRWQAGDRSGASEALASANQMLPQDKAIQRLQYSVARYSSKGVKDRRHKAKRIPCGVIAGDALEAPVEAQANFEMVHYHVSWCCYLPGDHAPISATATNQTAM